MFRDLLVHVDGSPAGRLRVQFAVDLAKRTSARLSSLYVTPPAEVRPRYKPTRVDKVAAEISAKLAADARTAAATSARRPPGTWPIPAGSRSPAMSSKG